MNGRKTLRSSLMAAEPEWMKNTTPVTDGSLRRRSAPVVALPDQQLLFKGLGDWWCLYQSLMRTPALVKLSCQVDAAGIAVGQAESSLYEQSRSFQGPSETARSLRCVSLNVSLLSL